MESAAFVLRSVLAITFAVAATAKVINMPALVTTLEALGIRGPSRRAIAWIVVLAEGAAATTFAIPLQAELSVWLSTGLVVCFVAASLRGLRSRDEIPCSCFGRSDSTLGLGTLVRAGLLEAAIGSYMFVSPKAASTWPGDLWTLLQLVTIVVAILILAEWLLVIPLLVRLVSVRRQLRSNVHPKAVSRSV